jgi:hypothetical protein
MSIGRRILAVRDKHTDNTVIVCPLAPAMSVGEPGGRRPRNAAR